MKSYFCSFVIALCVLCGTSFATTQDVIDRIAQRACETSSETILIVHEGKIIGCWGDRRGYTPIETRSITKTFVSIAAGLLLQDKDFCGIDAPIYNYYPEWNQGIKKDVTIRQLLNHTSGLCSDDEGTSIYCYPDVVQMALVSDFASYPGCAFKYNNKGTNLLAGVVRKASGYSVQELLRGRLFAPMGITSDTWLCDSVGNNYGMSHLTINAMDLAKMGMLIAQDGYWNGYSYLPKAWVDFMKTASQPYMPFYGALVWLGYYTIDFYWDQTLIDQYKAAGIPCKYIEALDILQGQVIHLKGHVNYGNYRDLCALQLASIFGSPEDVGTFFQLVENCGLPIARFEPGHLVTIAARGYGGQQLIIFPDAQLIGVRLAPTCGADQPLDTFPDFECLLGELVYEMNAAKAVEVVNTTTCE